MYSYDWYPETWGVTTFVKHLTTWHYIRHYLMPVDSSVSLTSMAINGWWGWHYVGFHCYEGETLGGGFTVQEFVNSHCHFLLLWNQHCSKSWDVADTTVVRKVKWVFLNGCKCKSPICTVTEVLNLCQDGIKASICLGIMLKNNDTSAEWMSYIQNVNDMTFYSRISQCYVVSSILHYLCITYHFIIVSVNWMCWFYMPSYCGLPEDDGLSPKCVGEEFTCMNYLWFYIIFVYLLVYIDDWILWSEKYNLVHTVVQFPEVWLCWCVWSRWSQVAILSNVAVTGTCSSDTSAEQRSGCGAQQNIWWVRRDHSITNSCVCFWSWGFSRYRHAYLTGIQMSQQSCLLVKVKGKVYPRTGHEGPEGE